MARVGGGEDSTQLNNGMDQHSEQTGSVRTCQAEVL